MTRSDIVLLNRESSILAARSVGRPPIDGGKSESYAKNASTEVPGLNEDQSETVTELSRETYFWYLRIP